MSARRRPVLTRQAAAPAPALRRVGNVRARARQVEQAAADVSYWHDLVTGGRMTPPERAAMREQLRQALVRLDRYTADLRAAAADELRGRK